MTQLEILNLERNGLSRLPSEFSKLSSLTVLNLASNELKSGLSEKLSTLTQLQELDLENNLLGEFPEGICVLKNPPKIKPSTF